MLANLVGPDTGIVLLVVIVVMLFGGSRLPKLARGLGSASHEFRKGLEDGERGEEDKSDKDVKQPEAKSLERGDKGAETIEGVKEGTEQEAS